MSIQAPSDKRFRRVHITPTRRRRLWPPDWRVVAALALGLGVVGYAGYQGVTLAMGADALLIQRITVEGNTRMSTGEVVSLLDGLRGQHMLSVNLETWKETLKASPWVADAAIRRVFPGRVVVAVVERVPIGIGRLGDALFLVDRQGNLIDEYGPNYAELDLPILTGLDGGRPVEEPRVDELRAALAVKVVDAVSTRRDLAARVSEIDVSDAHNAVLTLKDDPTLVRVGEEEFVRRLQTYFDLAPTLRERVPAADYADVRFDNRVYVRPVGAPSPRSRPVTDPPSSGAASGAGPANGRTETASANTRTGRDEKGKTAAARPRGKTKGKRR